MPANVGTRVDVYLAATYKLILKHSGNGGSAPGNVSNSVSSNQSSVTVSCRLSSTAPTREGYRFLGYRRSATGSTLYQPGAMISATFTRTETGTSSKTTTSANGTTTTTVTHTAQNKSTTLTFEAQWAINTYAVDFDANGGTGSPETVYKPYGQIIELPTEIPERENYNFLGWSTSSTGDVEYRAGDTYEANVAVTLYAVWELAAGSIKTISDVNVEGTGTVQWTITKQEHTYALAITYEDAPSVTVNNIAGGTTSCNFTIPSSWYEYITDTPTITATATLTSFEENVIVGVSTKTFPVGVSDSVHATISAFTATPHSENATIETWGIAVEGYSYVTLAVTATAAQYTTIANIAFSGPGVDHSSTSDTSTDSEVLPEDGTKTFTVTVTDSRGKQAIQNVTVTVYEYVDPVITVFFASRCDQNGTQSDTDGNYLTVFPMYRIASVNNYNFVSVARVDYKRRDVSYWTTGIDNVASDVWTAAFGNVDISRPYDVRITITDAVGNTYTVETSIQSCVGYSFGTHNDRVRFGGPVRMAGFECDFPAKFDSTINVIGAASFNGSAVFNSDAVFNGEVKANLIPSMTAELSTPGWYRVINVADTVGSVIDFTITIPGYSEAEIHKISYFMISGGNSVFDDEVSNSDTALVDKIRRTYDGGTQQDPTCAFDIHFVGESAKDVTVSYVVRGTLADYDLVTPMGLEAVDDAPAGESVYPIYYFVKTPYTPLWTGSWSSGNISVPGLRQFSVFMIGMDGQGTRILVLSPPGASYFRGVGGYASSSSNHATYFLGANKSGETLTMVNCHSVNQSGSCTNRTVTDIVGII